ncbi:MAG: RNA polymerase sigma-70 factor [Bacteroidota bacterium]
MMQMEEIATKRRLVLKDCSNEYLFALVQNESNYAAFEALYTRFYHVLINYSFRYMQSKQQADDVVSEVFYKIWKKRSGIHVTSSLRSYLFTAVRNMCLDYLRSESKIEHCQDDMLIEYEGSSDTPHQCAVGEELKIRIENAIEALPKDRRKVFRMSRDQGLKYKEIAETLGISIKTVETQMGRALKYLRGELSEYM